MEARIARVGGGVGPWPERDDARVRDSGHPPTDDVRRFLERRSRERGPRENSHERIAWTEWSCACTAAKFERIDAEAIGGGDVSEPGRSHQPKRRPRRWPPLEVRRAGKARLNRVARDPGDRDLRRLTEPRHRRLQPDSQHWR